MMRTRDWDAKGLASMNGSALESREIVRRDTVIRTKGFRALSGIVYGPNTTAAAFTAYLPKNPHDGAWVGFYGSWGQLAINNLTVDAGPNNIKHASLAAAPTIDFDEDYVLIKFVWDRANKQWRTFYG